MSWRIESKRVLRGDASRPALGLRVREATTRDLDTILDIEAAAHPTPWPRKIFEDELDLERSHVWVIEEPVADDNPAAGTSPIVAFLIFWVVHDEVHILNVAVAPEARRRGVATAVIGDIIEVARGNEASFVTLEVRRNNQAAISLYESLRFVIIGARPGYYADTGEDALIMSHLLA